MVRRLLCLTAVLALAAGCAEERGQSAVLPPGGALAPEVSAPVHAEIERWRVTATVTPDVAGPLEFTVESLRADRVLDHGVGSDFLNGRLGFRNTGEVPVLLRQIDNSEFADDAIGGDQLILMEGSAATRSARTASAPASAP